MGTHTLTKHCVNSVDLCFGAGFSRATSTPAENTPGETLSTSVSHGDSVFEYSECPFFRVTALNVQFQDIKNPAGRLTMAPRQPKQRFTFTFA